MGKDGVLKGIIGLQAVCMIVLAVFVVVRLLPSDPVSVSAAGKLDAAAGLGSLGGDAAAVVGSDTISESELVKQLKKQYGDSVLRTMMIRSALDQESAKGAISANDQEVQDELDSQMQGYADKDSFYREMKEQLGMSRDDVYADAMYRLLLEKWMTRDITVDDSKVDAYMQEHAAELAPSAQIHLRWIVTATEQEASDVLEELGRGGDFAELARQRSTDEGTASGGGDLGLVDEQDPFVDPGVLRAAKRLDPGDIAGPIGVAGGYAVMELMERVAPRAASDRELRQRLRRLISLDEAGSLKDGENKLLQQYRAVDGPVPAPSPARG